MSANAFKAADGFADVVGDDDGPDVTPCSTPRTRVDLAPCNFAGTFRNPCFWVLVGVLGTIAFQYVMAGKKGGGS